jgi:hypothetical protein
MPKSTALLAVCFCAGLIGGLISSLLLWLLGSWGLPAMAGVKLAPALTDTWLYPRLIWGGLWAVPYFFSVAVPRVRRHWVRKALWFSLLPTLAMLFVIFPYQMHLGQAGLKLGLLTPLFVIFINLVWGFFTGVFTRLLWGR